MIKRSGARSFHVSVELRLVTKLVTRYLRHHTGLLILSFNEVRRITDMVINDNFGESPWPSLIGSLLGAVAVSLANFLEQLAFERALFSDGLYIILYFLYVPQGAWLGALTGYGLSAVGRVNRRRTGAILIAGSGLLIAVGLLFAYSYPANHWDYLIGNFGVALLWAAGIIPWGIAWAKSARSSD